MNERHLRARLFHILHKPSPENQNARYVNYLLAFLIFTNALFVVLETVPALAAAHRLEFRRFEIFSTALFVVEYVARLWVCVEQGRYARPVTGRLRYALHPCHCSI